MTDLLERLDKEIRLAERGAYYDEPQKHLAPFLRALRDRLRAAEADRDTAMHKVESLGDRLATTIEDLKKAEAELLAARRVCEEAQETDYAPLTEALEAWRRTRGDRP